MQIYKKNISDISETIKKHEILKNITNDYSIMELVYSSLRAIAWQSVFTADCHALLAKT